MKTEQVNKALLDSCRELRAALAAAMRVIVVRTDALKVFEAEIAKLEIPGGIGVRASLAIEAAEKIGGDAGG